MNHELALITPTRDRVEAFALCALWMSRQAPTYLGRVQWLVVDDGDFGIDHEFYRGAWGDRWDLWRGLNADKRWTVQHVRRAPSDDACTLQDNLLEAIPLIDAPKVLIIEDDEWYASTYLQQMSAALDQGMIAGEKNAHYYNVSSRRWFQPDNQLHASLCRTGFRHELLGDLAAAAGESKAAKDVFVDLRLWKAHAADGCLFPWRGLSVGIKGMPGRGGLGRSHRWDAFPHRDPKLVTLTKWIGAQDASVYARFMDPARVADAR